MKRLPLVAVLATTLLVALALPAGAKAAHTLPLTTSCGPFDIIEGDGSLVGFDIASRPVVLHGVDGRFIIEVFIDGATDPVGFVEEVEDFFKGKGNGLSPKLKPCTADSDELIFADTLDLTEETAALILAEFGIVVDPAEGDEVTITGRFAGTLLVQFPGR